MESLPSTGPHYPLTRPLLLTGVAAPLLYAFTVIWGATLFPGYSHLAHPISSLTQAGRDGAAGLVSLFVIYNVLVIVFGISGISLSLGQRRWIASFSFLIATGIAGLLMVPFPQDPIGAPMSTSGVVHIVLAAIESFGSMGAIGAAALASRSAPGQKPMSVFSFACLAVVFVSGGLAAVGIGAGWAYAGLLERITIGGFELWLLVTAAMLFRRAVIAHSRFSSQPSADAA